jgi:predicted lipoprotein
MIDMLDKNDLQAIQEMMQASLQSNLQAINERLDTMQDDITIIKSDVKTLKNDVKFNHKTEINVIDYIENRLDEKIDSKINQLKAELNKTA